MKQLNKLHATFIDIATRFDEEIQDVQDNMNAELNIILHKEKLKLIDEICKDYKLNVNELKTKYLNITTVDDKKTTSKETSVKKITDGETVLKTIVIETKKFYYENKDAGKVYNDKTECVGIFANNKIVFFQK
jgi:glucan-binding YG repeat protein